jgi:hypothetical protein
MASPRACGTRVEGAVYMEIPLSRTGVPLSQFIFCPPKKVNLEEQGLTSVGTKLIQNIETGVWHVFDVIGEASYPNVADFLEETSRLGVSRRISRNTDFSKLTQGSCLFVIHRRAWIDNWLELQGANRLNHFVNLPVCATGKHTEEDGWKTMCSKHWWSDVEGSHEGYRKMQTFTYQGEESPIELQHSPAIFAGFPIIRLAVIRDEGPAVEAARRIQSLTSLPVEIEED